MINYDDDSLFEDFKEAQLIKLDSLYKSSDAEYSGFGGQYHTCWCPGS